jgi:predicted DNA-binding WGR domain protein
MSRREFQFIGGGSRKFWNIELEDTSFTVSWGRIGTQGQSKSKSFPSEDKARAAYDKLIAEKLKEGYTELTASAAPPPDKLQPKTKKVPSPAAPPPEEPSPAATPPPADPGRTLEISRRIDLDADDWLWATWRKRTPRQRPPAPPFDLDDCLKRLAKVRTGTYGWEWKFETVNIAETLSRPEAHFWFLAMSEPRDRQVSPKDLAARYAKRAKDFTGELELEDVAQRLEKEPRYLSTRLFPVLANLFKVRELVQLLCGDFQIDAGKLHSWSSAPHVSELQAVLVQGFRQLLPFLTDAEAKSLQEQIRSQLDPARLPSDMYQAFPPAFYLGAMLGLHKEVAAIVAHLKDETYQQANWSDHYHKPQLMVFGLGSPQQVESEMRRLKLRLRSEEHVRAWLACTEFAALDYVRDSILAETNKEKCEELLKPLTLVHALEAAEVFLELKLSSKTPAIARAWLDQDVGNAIVGLLPTATGRGKTAEAALQYLREAKRQGHENIMRRALPSLPAEVAQRITSDILDCQEKTYQAFDEKTLPSWLSTTLAEPLPAKKSTTPAWAQSGSLPPITVGNRRLSEQHTEAVLQALRQGDFQKPPALLTALRQHADRASLDTFAWSLFERWLQEGAPSKERWAMGAIGFLGGDPSVLKITPLIRAWPGESQHQRAVFGLECLRAVGTDTALMQLNGIAQKLKFKALKTRAMECMTAIAEERKMTREELEDCIVPDCDLDERGRRVFDFGPRQFTFVLSTDMKPMIRDDTGKMRDDLPKPGSKDDAAKAAEAVAAWKLLKKQIRDVAKIQVTRLEQAMVTGRRWRGDAFEKLLVRHPLMTNLVRLVLWGVYDAVGKLQTTFRVTEEQDFGDVKDEAWSLPPDCSVGIVHPLHLTPELASAWGEVFSDYEIIAPFPQLGRPTFQLEKGEETSTELTRFAKVKIPATALVGTLERLNWVRGIPQDAGIFYEHSKPFYGANITAVAQYEEGVPVGYMEGWDDQRLTSCFFVPAIYTPTSYPKHSDALPLGKVDPVVISEVLRDLTLVASKGV